MKIIFTSLLMLAFEVMAMDIPMTSSGTFEIILDRIEVIFETPEIASWDFKVKRISKAKERYLVGTLTIGEPFGNDFDMEVKTLKKQGGEYKYRPFSVPRTPFCELIKNDKYAWPDIAKGSDLPENPEEGCPLAVRKFNLYNVTTDLNNVPSVKKLLTSGEYAAEINYYRGDKQISSYRLYNYVNNV